MVTRPILVVPTTGGFTPVSLSATGLPPNLTFTDNGDGTGSIEGTIAAGAAGSSPYAALITATDAKGVQHTEDIVFNVSA